MGHYSDCYAAEENAALLRDFGPEQLPELTEQNLRYNIARANRAEARLAKIEATLRDFQRLLPR